jgi:hypothetical protein
MPNKIHLARFGYIDILGVSRGGRKFSMLSAAEGWLASTQATGLAVKDRVGCTGRCTGKSVGGSAPTILGRATAEQDELGLSAGCVLNPGVVILSATHHHLRAKGSNLIPPRNNRE